MFSSVDLTSNPIDDLGGVTLAMNKGAVPTWTRLASVEFTAWGAGEANFDLAPGKLELARMGQGNIDWSNVQLGSRSLQIISGWQNQETPADVDGNGSVTLGDALEVIGELRRGGDRQLRQLHNGSQAMIDVNGDGSVTLSDSLEVVSHLRGMQRGPVIGEVGERGGSREASIAANATPASEASHADALREAADAALRLADAALAADEADSAEVDAAAGEHTDFDSLLDTLALDIAAM